ncbi:MAG TPA: amino acid adenylation domain-containing protein, partial [Thermoanaerobaculia bacterium]|nr:amino acid adenylation domain-containing protein [Thermoanaerobaculia bacterium]
EPLSPPAVHHAFAAQARRAPDAMALSWPEGGLTYGELDRRAGRLARSLRRRGLIPGERAILLLERSPELAVAQLAVWKAGGVAVPLDPAWPRDRVERLKEESGAVLVVDGELSIEEDGPPPEDLSTSADAAYVIFTSGSTGRPKGVVVEHGSLAFTLAAAQAVLGWDPMDVTSWSSAPTFDISLLELWAPLLAGGVCEMLPAGPGTDLAAWRELLPRLTRLHAVPGLMRPLIDLVRDEAPPCAGLRTLLVGGEAVPAGLLADLRRTFPNADLGVLYGPTEATIVATVWRVPSPEVPVRSLLGRPLPGVEIQVRDAAGRIVPANVVGEIWIGGPGVARGYLNREQETEERFQKRSYRTGDLARWTAAGELEFRGRADNQVKIRGVRIEPGEVEAALSAAPGVREAAVTVRDDLPGGRGLVAYVAGEGAADALRSFLADRLPAYMVPAAFVLLDRLPRTAHGKVDRRALPAPNAAGLDDAGRVAPRTPLESRLAAMWQEVIGLETEVGAHDNFFSLGGDSIKGAIFTNRLGRQLGEHVPVALIFEAPTVAELAAALEAEYPAALGLSLPGPLSHPLPRTGRGDKGEGAPLSFAQERLWFLQQLDPQGATYNMGDALVLRGRLDTAALEAAWREILRRHQTLRARFLLRDGLPVAEVGPVPDDPLPRIDLAGLGTAALDAAQRLAHEEAVRPFDLQRGPVVRGLLLRLGPDHHALLFTTHHIVCDGWSLGIWAREIQIVYTAFAAGGPRLPEPPMQYADFAAWQRSWLEGSRLEAQVSYWRERLRGAAPYLELPLDHPRPAFQSHRGGAASLSLPAVLADRLRALSSRHDASLFMTLLAAFSLHLGRLSGQDDILVGSPIAGRIQPEVEGLIGCFLNTLVLRADLSGEPSFRDLLRRVRETALGAFSHQDVPFEKVLEELRPERDTSRPSLFQVLFNLVNVPRAAMDLPGLALENLGPGEPFAKFDLTLYISEEDGLALHLVYNSDLFDPPRMEEMLRQYRLLLEQATEHPESPVASYSLLTSEAAAVLPNPVASLDHPWPGAVHDLFADQARHAPDRVALIDRDGLWTYGELDRAVHRLAARLLADGLGPGDLVAVWAHRGAALAWALLGIVKAGAAFTILDPAYPTPRLIEVLRIARPRGLLRIDGAGPLPPDLEVFVEEQGVVVSPVTGEGGGFFSTGPHDVASVAFTSGSTGLPKGIVQTHGSMSYFLPWHREALGYSESDRHTMLSGLAHDPLQRDIFYSLATGATLCVPDPGRIGEPGYLAAWMAEQRVTVANLTPAMALLLTELQPGAATLMPDLRVTVLAGDLLTRELVERLRALAPRTRFLNVYGTTESHRALSYHLVEAGEDARRRRLKQTLPLGRGQTGCQFLVLTPSGSLAGIGEIGEVAVRSPWLARGYLGDEALTRERFGINPFTGDPGDRLYRTGDLGRYLPDGEVEAAGRADQQVKIRGFRVEPGEVEAELLRAPGV